MRADGCRAATRAARCVVRPGTARSPGASAVSGGGDVAEGWLRSCRGRARAEVQRRANGARKVAMLEARYRMSVCSASEVEVDRLGAASHDDEEGCSAVSKVPAGLCSRCRMG